MRRDRRFRVALEGEVGVVGITVIVVVISSAICGFAGACCVLYVELCPCAVISLK